MHFSDFIERTKRLLPSPNAEFQSSTDFEKLSFFSEDSEFTIKNVVFGAKIGALLFLLFSFLDYVAYREHFVVFFFLRFLCAASIFGIGFVSKTKWAKRRYRFISILIPLTCSFFISAMILVIRDPTTIYYAGLNLCIVGTGTLFQWTSITSSLVFLMYICSTVPFLGNLASRAEFGTYIGSCLFIVSTAVLVIFGHRNHNNIRFSEFMTRAKLRRNQIDLQRKNIELQTTMKTLRETERQLFQSEKMSLLGELSAGVIHEIANPLNFASQAVFILEKRLAKSRDEEEFQEIIDDIQEGLDRMRGIIQDLRNFSHTGPETGEQCLVEDIVKSSIRILGNRIEESGTALELDIAPNIKILGVKNQISQVITNLINNGIHAVAGQKDGALRITAKVASDRFVLITITDNGPGIPSSDLGKLFDPFFTTKDPGEGTGLGLSISYRIIQAHGGEITVESESEEGTTFSVTLPSSE